MTDEPMNFELSPMDVLLLKKFNEKHEAELRFIRLRREIGREITPEQEAAIQTYLDARTAYHAQHLTITEAPRPEGNFWLGMLYGLLFTAIGIAGMATVVSVVVWIAHAMEAM